MNSNIRNTLLDKLFLHPNAIQNKNFTRFKSLLFPGEPDFINFLKLDDQQEIIELAKTILIKLLYQHHFAPPSRLMFNLLYSQEQEINTVKKGDYIPQDHFVHLVNLYLLGIYIFSYHKGIRNKILFRLNIFKRKLNLNKDLDIDSYEIFSSIWAHFVLYHDLGYPLERINPKDRYKDTEIAKWIEPFQRIRKSLEKDLSLKILSKLIVLYLILREEDEIDLNSMYLEHSLDYTYYKNDSKCSIKFDSPISESIDVSKYPGKEDIINFINNWKNSKFISQLNGFNSLRTILSFFPDRYISAILEDTITGKPIILLQCKSEGIEFLHFGDEQSLPSIIKRHKTKLRNLAFHCSSFPNNRYVWRYFINEHTNYFNSFVEDLFDSKIDKWNFIKNTFHSDEECNNILLTKDDFAVDIGSVVFHRFSRILGYLKRDEEKPQVLRKLKGFLDNYSSTGELIPTLVSSAVQTLMKEEVKEKRLNTLDVLLENETPELSAKKFVEHLEINSEKLVKPLTTLIEPLLEKNVKLDSAVRDCFGIIRDKLDSSIDNSAHDIDFDSLSQTKLDENFNLGKIVDGTDAYSKILDQGLNKLKLENFNSLINNFTPAWIDEEQEYLNKYIDHGFLSGILSITSASYYQLFINLIQGNDSSVDDKTPIIIRLALDTSSEHFKKYFTNLNGFISSKVSETILLHNLFPKDIDNANMKKYRTKLGIQPFSFLAILADTFQKWDRKKLLSQANSDTDSFLPGSRYNFVIINELFHVTYEALKIDHGSKEIELRTSLKDYLHNGDLLLKLSLIEEPK